MPCALRSLLTGLWQSNRQFAGHTSACSFFLRLDGPQPSPHTVPTTHAHTIRIPGKQSFAAQLVGEPPVPTLGGARQVSLWLHAKVPKVTPTGPSRTPRWAAGTPGRRARSRGLAPPVEGKLHTSHSWAPCGRLVLSPTIAWSGKGWPTPPTIRPYILVPENVHYEHEIISGKHIYPQPHQTPPIGSPLLAHTT